MFPGHHPHSLEAATKSGGRRWYQLPAALVPEDDAESVDQAAEKQSGQFQPRDSYHSLSKRVSSHVEFTDVHTALRHRFMSGGPYFQRELRFVDFAELQVGSFHTFIPEDRLAAFLRARGDMSEREKEKTFEVLQKLAIPGKGLPQDVFCTLFEAEDSMAKVVVFKVFLMSLLFPAMFIAIMAMLQAPHEIADANRKHAAAVDSTRSSGPVVEERPQAWLAKPADLANKLPISEVHLQGMQQPQQPYSLLFRKASQAAALLTSRYFISLERLVALFGWTLWDEEHNCYAKRRLLEAILVVLFIGYVATTYVVIAGLARVPSWFVNQQGVEALNRGCLVETVFPGAIYVFFCAQVALCFERYQGKFSKVLQRSSLARDLDGKQLTLKEPVDVETCVVQLPLDLNGACNSCGLYHTSALPGTTVDLLTHLLCNQCAYAFQGWKNGEFWNVSFTISGSLLLSFVTVIVRGAIGESYASTNTSWSTGVDVSIVVMAQVALFVTYGIYFSMLMHVKQLFKEALFFMRMLTNMMKESTCVFNYNGVIIALPHLDLKSTRNVMTWYQLRRYVQLLGNQKVSQMEMVVVIICAAIAVWIIIIVCIVALGLTALEGLHTTSLALQALAVIIVGGILLSTYLFEVLMLGNKFNTLQRTHVTIMIDTQMELIAMMGAHLSQVENMKLMQAHDAIAVVRKNIKHNDEFFGLFGVPLDSHIVQRVMGIGTAIAISLLSMLISYVVKRWRINMP